MKQKNRTRGTKDIRLPYWFAVEGYKAIPEGNPVTINLFSNSVIAGANSIGKSTVIEAMRLFFHHLRTNASKKSGTWGEGHLYESYGNILELPEDIIDELCRLSPEKLFNRESFVQVDIESSKVPSVETPGWSPDGPTQKLSEPGIIKFHLCYKVGLEDQDKAGDYQKFGMFSNHRAHIGYYMETWSFALANPNHCAPYIYLDRKKTHRWSCAKTLPISNIDTRWEKISDFSSILEGDYQKKYLTVTNPFGKACYKVNPHGSPILNEYMQSDQDCGISFEEEGQFEAEPSGLWLSQTDSSIGLSPSREGGKICDFYSLLVQLINGSFLRRAAITKNSEGYRLNFLHRGLDFSLSLQKLHKFLEECNTLSEEYRNFQEYFVVMFNNTSEGEEAEKNRPSQLLDFAVDNLGFTYGAERADEETLEHLVSEAIAFSINLENLFSLSVKANNGKTYSDVIASALSHCPEEFTEIEELLNQTQEEDYPYFVLLMILAIRTGVSGEHGRNRIYLDVRDDLPLEEVFAKPTYSTLRTYATTCISDRHACAIEIYLHTQLDGIIGEFVGPHSKEGFSDICLFRSRHSIFSIYFYDLVKRFNKKHGNKLEFSYLLASITAAQRFRSLRGESMRQLVRKSVPIAESVYSRLLRVAKAEAGDSDFNGLLHDEIVATSGFDSPIKVIYERGLREVDNFTLLRLYNDKNRYKWRELMPKENSVGQGEKCNGLDCLNKWLCYFGFKEIKSIYLHDSHQHIWDMRFYIDGGLISEQGHGIKQFLPLLISFLTETEYHRPLVNKEGYHPVNKILLWEQPEVHLHPLVMSRLTQLIKRMDGHRHVTVVETHSREFIDAFCLDHFEKHGEKASSAGEEKFLATYDQSGGGKERLHPNLQFLTEKEGRLMSEPPYIHERNGVLEFLPNDFVDSIAEKRKREAIISASYNSKVTPSDPQEKFSKALADRDENYRVEFKEDFMEDFSKEVLLKEMQAVFDKDDVKKIAIDKTDQKFFKIVKVIASFLNSKGGTLYVGVRDEKNITEVNKERVCGIDPPEGMTWETWINGLLSSFAGEKSLFFPVPPEGHIVIDKIKHKDKFVLSIACKPILLKEQMVLVQPRTKIKGKSIQEKFYIRRAASCISLSPREILRYSP